MNWEFSWPTGRPGLYGKTCHRRGVGSDDLKGYHSRFNYLSGMTPDIERCWSLNTLGERFLLYRIDVRDRRAHARRALDGAGAKQQVRAELREAVREFFEGLQRFQPTASAEMKDRTIDLAEILATCRTYVHREKNGDLTYQPQAEVPTRVAQQLLRLGLSVALVRGREALTEEEFSLMKQVALDSLPGNRRALLSALWDNHQTWQPLDTFQKCLATVCRNTVETELKNLAALGVVNQEVRQVTVPTANNHTVVTTKTLYRLSGAFAGYCQNVAGVPAVPPG
jgi:hypothetical protein